MVLNTKTFNILRNYTLNSLFALVYHIILTRLFYSSSRLIRRPFYIRGKQYIDLGHNLTTGVGCRIDAFPKEPKKVITIGTDVQINDYVHIGAIESIVIGNHVLIASKVLIIDHNHGSYSTDNSHTNPLIPPIDRDLSSAKIRIEDNVWIGEFSVILPGVNIGEGSIIGAMSVVTKSIPAYSIAVGNPARVIKRYDFERYEWVSV